MKRSYLLAAPLLVSLCVMPISAFARDHEREHNSAQHFRDADHDRNHESRQRGNEVREHHERRLREERREHLSQTHHNYVRHDRDRDDAPRRAGWDHGKKQGWQGGDQAPGQAKKAYDRDRGR